MSLHHLTELLHRYSPDFAPVVPFDAATDRLLLFDFSAANSEITTALVNDTVQFTHYINEKLREAGARYGIGGYAEHRPMYGRSKLFGHALGQQPETKAREAEEPRRFHLGIDIWGKPHTAVRAPLDGLVHSFAFNNAYGDYGATIILSHQLEGISFHTLYGHLSLNSIKNLYEGMRVEKGDVIADFGLSQENGSWPPHLHIQLISDLQGWSGDYPGVCRYSEREQYLANCPNPDLILRMLPAAV